MPLHRAEGFDQGNGESGDNSNTSAASESVRPPPASPQKKRKKVSRSQSIPAIPAQIQTPGGFCPPPKGFAPPNETMVGYNPYEEHMHGASPMQNMGGHGMPLTPPGSLPGTPVPGHPMMHGAGGMPSHIPQALPPHMQHPAHSPHSPLSGVGHMMSHPSSSVRYMRQSSAPMPPPHMSHMYPQAVSPHMGPGGAPLHLMTSHYSPNMSPAGMPPGGMVGPVSMANRVYPADQPMVFNQTNPHAPPIYPCGICHKEINDSDQALLCETSCNFWFHRQCTGMTEMAFHYISKEVFAAWACDPCLSKKNVPLIQTRS